MPTSPRATESDRLVESLGQQFKALVKTHWLDLWGYSNGDGVKGAVSFSIKHDGNQYSLNSRLCYGIRFQHRVHEKAKYV